LEQRYSFLAKAKKDEHWETSYAVLRAWICFTRQNTGVNLQTVNKHQRQMISVFVEILCQVVDATK